MGTLSLTDPVNGTANDATTIANNNAAIKAVVNGGIDNTNVNATAAIALTKLASTPAARVYNSGNITSNTSSASLALTWDSESFDNATIHNVTTNTSRLTVGTTGIYALRATIDVQAGANTATRTVQFLKNGASTITSRRYSDLVASAATSLEVNDIAELSSGDYVEVVYLTAGTTTDTITGGTNSTWASISFVGNQ